ncbi:MAG: (Fe-S)-binding protein, partial [Omnitrophica WOR_2 bacterium]
TGLQKLVRSSNSLPRQLKAMEGILPPIKLQFTRQGKTYPAAEQKQGRVLFFTGCIQEGFLSSVNQATIRVLQKNGYEVFIPKGQNCCGAAHLHLGDKTGAQRLARQNIDAFPVQEYDAVICNAGGCGVSLKEYPALLETDPAYAERAVQFSRRVKDINEFLFDHLNANPAYPLNVRAVYSDSCHLRHGQKVIKQPRALLKQIAGLELVELASPDRCCGSAGVYNIAQVDTANAILDAKMDDIAATGAGLIVTSNTGCQMQLIAGVRRKGLQARVMHVVEVLDLAYRGDEGRS